MCLAYPMKVIEIKENQAVVDASGIRRQVHIGLLRDLRVGDYVMVHAGFAIETLEEKEAKKTLKVFKEFTAASKHLKKR
jgi:hydrogenase expression/formation protein HypC